ncbi:Ig-like domain-containing protein [Eubacterium sp. AB3007]|uniref:Ig-like domain-containing protein n=1 Tax=Eubacterium sp. AB3007 TaxID=1392487 RepID=UPI000482CC5F|nr:Ig-like domain-containing protein [Eubacterium sp. AB3007]
MKRTGAIACLTMMIVMMMTVCSFGADSFHITRTYPANGEENTTKDNMCVKIYFNSEVGNKASKAANKNAFSITNKKGKEFPSRIYYNKNNPQYALVVIDTNKVKSSGKNAIKDDTEYICTLSENFIDNKGNKLGDDPKRVISFRTMNQGRNTLIYMVMMFLMFGGMMLFTVRQTAKQKMEEELGKGKDAKEEPFNPYKEAKRTGKSVEEVLAKHEKEVAKKEAARKAKAKREKELDEYYEENDNYRVSKPLRIADAGATYRTGRAKLAEERRAEEARLKAERKATNYGKNPKGKKK